MKSAADPDMQLFLDRLLTRSVLTQDEQQAVLDLPGQREVVKARSDVVAENEKVSHARLIVKGLVGRVGRVESGVRQLTAFYIPGDMADLHSTVRPVEVGGLHALTESTLFTVPHEAMRRLAALYPAVAEALWRDCMLDAAILMQRVVNVGTRDARARLAHIFCEMAVRYAKGSQPALQYDFPVTQELLGEAAALTAVHVNRTLSALRMAELVSLSRGEVTITNWPKLCAVGDFDAVYLLGDTGAEQRRRLLEH
jgi:CRP-like cAMP-binding protein